MTTLFFASYGMSFAAPAIAAALVAVTARSRKGSFLTLTIVEVIVIFAVLALHWEVYLAHPEWVTSKIAGTAYLIVGLLGTAAGLVFYLMYTMELHDEDEEEDWGY